VAAEAWTRRIGKGDEKEEKMDKVEKVEKVHESYV